MKNISPIYDCVKSVIQSEENTSFYEDARSTLNKRLKLQKREYLNRARENSKLFQTKKHNALPGIIAASIVVVIGAALWIIGGVGKQTVPVESSSVNSSTTLSSVESNSDDLHVESSSQQEKDDEISSSEITESTSSETSKVIDNNVESYNGYKLGEIVSYFGTVHYVSSDTNELSGACYGGKAMISGINPEGLHKFHLVSAEEKCTVYGWVDEAFIKHIE